ncbi:hypothetical protein NMY22_g11836 [Coprinellus aureogranulatus]|nr:hypothetical protein NMY22_g11836 [Coprinellus aureogranulatus]
MTESSADNDGRDEVGVVGHEDEHEEEGDEDGEGVEGCAEDAGAGWDGSPKEREVGGWLNPPSAQQPALLFLPPSPPNWTRAPPPSIRGRTTPSRALLLQRQSDAIIDLPLRNTDPLVEDAEGDNDEAGEEEGEPGGDVP